MTFFKQNSFFDDEPVDPANAGFVADGGAVDPPAEQAGDGGQDDAPLGAESPAHAAQPDLSDTPVEAEVPPFTGMIDPGQGAVDAFFGPPRLDRPRPERPPLVSRWVWIAVAATLGVLLLGVLAGFLSSQAANISVPQVTGVDVSTAKTRLAEQGLAITVVERRFSSRSADTVLSQTPAPGTKLKRGESVSVVVSAGSEQFSMPNVVGDGLLLAQGLLQTRGLEVRVESQPSQQPSDTVLASNPSAGSAVHTGDIVRLTVAAPGPNTTLLLPYDMRGVTVVIDPAPVADAMTDVPLDVARRLRSLIEASHGIVVTTRALADTSTLEEAPARAQRAGASTSTVAIGLSTIPVGTGGLIVYAPSPVLAFASTSARLCSRIASDLASEAGSVQSATSTTDSVLAAANSPWSRIQLGSFSQREDVAKFSDTAWEDSVARALYRAIAGTYGKKTSAQ